MIHVSCLIFLLTVGNARAAQATPPVIAHTIDGPRAAAPLLDVSADFSVKLGGGEPAVIAGRDLISLRRASLPQPGSCPPPFVQLTTGDRLPLAMPIKLRLDDSSLHVDLAGPLATENYAVPQAAVAFIALTKAESPADKWQRDLVVLKSGDRLAGKLEALDAKSASLTVGKQTETIPLDRIAQIAFDPDFQASPGVKGPYAELILSDGARLSAAKITAGEGNQLTAESLLGHRFAFPANALAALRVRQGKAVYLDDVKPKTFEATPFLDIAWPLSTGRTLLGRPLKLGADVYPLGLAMHSRSKATYALNPGDAWFEAMVGVDPAAGPQAAVRIDVELDGKSVPEISRVLKAGDPPAVLRIDLKKAKTVSLITDFGPRGDIQGHAIWADARLVKR